MELTPTISKVSTPQQICAAQIKASIKTLKSGANDVVVVETPMKGEYKATPLHIRIGQLTNWKTTIKSKGKKAAIKLGIIPTAKILVNNTEVLSHANLILNQSGEEVLIQRPSQLGERMQDCDISSTFTNDEIKSMGLKYGLNRAVFIGGENLGNLEIQFSVYLLNENDRLIFTDIDGTITRTDMKGFLGGNLSNLFPSVNNLFDVHHANVIKFLHKAANNGYIIIYLTARPIDFDTQTRKYLFKALQNRDGGYSLPESPLFSGHKVGLETTESYNPSIIKATTIRLILDLFTLGEKVVYGAYGNKNTDAIAYTNSAILPERVYLIDENSCMTRLKDSSITSYEEHANNIDAIYPKIICPL